jgi:exodeoxyribonuclease V alpha subunit
VSRRPLSPRGSAWVRFRGEGEVDEISRLLSHLRIAAGHDVGDDLYLVEEVARTAWSLGPIQQRTFALLVLATYVAGRQGSTRVPLGGGLRGPMGKLLAELAGDAIDLRAALRDLDGLAKSRPFDTLVGDAGAYLPIVVADGSVYQQRMHWAEQQLIERLRARLEAADLPAPGLAEASADLAARPASGVALSDEQRAAAELAARRPLAVISGGPGTGKTAIAIAILRLACRLGIEPRRMVLAAPTGKAASRLAESIRRGISGVAAPAEADAALAAALPEPQTLHRLLGYLPARDRFRHHDKNPLAADLVIVDEASMVDLLLMERLVRAVPEGARLVLLGDADQLPSVDAGAVLADLIALEPGRRAGHAARLTHSYRMLGGDPAGAQVLRAARAVNAGDATGLFSGLQRRDRAGALQHRGAEHYDTGRATASLADLVGAWYRRVRGGDDTRARVRRTYRWDGGFDEPARADIDALLAHHGSMRLLTVTRHGPAGAAAINQRLHERALADSRLEMNPPLCAGEPIMVLSNDYGRRLFNGDQGVVLLVHEAGEDRPHLRAVFPREDDHAMYPIDALRGQIELAYAITVHKSQGSEFDGVVVILPDRDLPLCTRELLYTALTRARHSAVIAGSRDLIKKTIGRRIQRWSGVRAGLGDGSA